MRGPLPRSQQPLPRPVRPRKNVRERLLSRPQRSKRRLRRHRRSIGVLREGRGTKIRSGLQHRSKPSALSLRRAAQRLPSVRFGRRPSAAPGVVLRLRLGGPGQVLRESDVFGRHVFQRHLLRAGANPDQLHLQLGYRDRQHHVERICHVRLQRRAGGLRRLDFAEITTTQPAPAVRAPTFLGNRSVNLSA